MNSLQEKNGGSLKKNDIGKVIFQTQKPLFVDRYNQEKILGSFLIIDEISNATAGAGIITEKASNPNTSNSLNNFSSSSENLTLEQKVELSKIVLAYTFLQYPKIFATCSFGKDSRVLVDLILQLNKETKFYGIDTGYEFPESLQFAKELVEETHMNFSWIFAPEEERKKIEKEYGNEMIKNEQYKCCAMKRPALATITPKYQAWITGLRRDEALSRKNIPVIDTGGEIVKINPLAFWTKDDIWEYIHSKNLSYHPLYNEGYPSLGCAPCTQKPSDETKGNERAGRFVGTYEEGSECGLHK